MEKIEKLAVESVKKAYHNYFEKKDSSYILENCRYNNTHLLGITDVDWENVFEITNEHEHVQMLNDNMCVVASRIELTDKAGRAENKRNVECTFVCEYIEENIKFCHIHISGTEGETVRIESIYDKDESRYRKTLKYLYDVMFEYDSLNNSFAYDPIKYQELFEVDSHFISMDQWFWNMCTECVHPDDAELLDIFRSNDIGKRIRTDDCVVEDDIRIRNHEKGYIWIHMVVVFLPNDAKNNIEKIFVMFKNIDAEKKLELEYMSKSRIDSLTGLFNRTYMEEQIAEYLSSDKNAKGIYVVIDIDEFKTVNDTFGHITGDEVLTRTAKSLNGSVSNGDIVGRIGGDEFVIFLKNCDDEKIAKSRLTNILNSVQFEYSECQKEISVRCSAGATIASYDNHDLEKLYAKADRNLYEAKNAGKNTFRIS